MIMCNLIEYGDNYWGTSRSLWQFKRDQFPNNDVDLTIDKSQSFKYKAAVVVKTPNAVNNSEKKTQK